MPRGGWDSAPPESTSKFAGAASGALTTTWAGRRRHSPGPAVSFAQPMEDDGDWECPGVNWEEGAMTDDWEEDGYDLTLEEDIADSWCEREPPNKRGRDGQDDHTRQTSADVMRDLKEENQQLRAQITQLMSRLDSMCCRMDGQQAQQQTAPLPATPERSLSAPEQEAVSALAVPGQPFAQQASASQDRPALTHDAALVAAEVPVRDEFERVSTSLYQITLQGGTIAHDWMG
eukprot:3353767-Amphidinium_carterae.1